MEFEPNYYQKPVRHVPVRDPDWSESSPQADVYHKVVLKNVPNELTDVGLKTFLERRVGRVTDVHTFVPRSAGLQDQYKMAYVTFEKYGDAMACVDFSRSNQKMLMIYPGAIPLRVDRYRTPEEMLKFRTYQEDRRRFEENSRMNAQQFPLDRSGNNSPSKSASPQCSPVPPQIVSPPPPKCSYPTAQSLEKAEIPEDLDDVAYLFVNGEKVKIERSDTLDHSQEKPHVNVCATCRQICDCLCDRCGDTWYCGPVCQKFHYPRHKNYCDSSPKAKSAAEKAKIEDQTAFASEDSACASTGEQPSVSAPTVMRSDLPRVTVPLGVPIQVVTSHYESPEDFYIQLTNEDEIVRLNTAVLNEFNQPASQPFHQPQIGEIVVAKWKPVDSDEDGIYYRAEVLEYDDTTKMCQIRFIDYGNCDSLPVGNISFVLTPTERAAVMTTPIQAIKAIWEGVSNEDDPMEVVVTRINEDLTAVLRSATGETSDVTKDIGELLEQLVINVAEK